MLREIADHEILVRDAFTRALSGEAARRSLQYSTTEGDPGLRAAAADLMTARGVPTGAGDLLITSGSQQALTLVATALLDPGDAVLVEEPSYLAAIQAFTLAGARVVPVACDDDGVLPDALDDAAAASGARLAYLIPTFQNPTGRTLPLERRRAIAAIAERRGLWLIEDDPYGELRYAGEPVAPLAAQPGAEDRTLSLSTLSKIAAPGLRLGWVRAPADVRAPLVVAKQAADLHSSTIDQAAAAIWLARTDLAAHVGHLRDVYRERRDALLDGIGDGLPPGSTWNRPDGGMFVWARLPEGHDAQALLRAAIAKDVAFVPGAPFFAGEPDVRALRLSFTTHAPDEIATGLGRLRAAWAAA